MNDQARDEAIARAARAFREESHGRSDAAASTRARLLAGRRRNAQQTTFWLAAAAALVLGLGVPTAWAWWTGELDRWLAEIEESGRRERASADVDPASAEVPVVQGRADEHPTTEVQATEVPATEVPATEVPATEAGADDRPAIATPALDAPRVRATSIEARTFGGVQLEAPESETTEVDPPEVGASGGLESPERESTEAGPVDPEERLAFERADALHTARDAAAIGSWDAYLARYPSGRFAIEARYARALCLVRLGRIDEARTALAPFAEGRYGRYREREASALLGALAP